MPVPDVGHCGESSHGRIAGTRAWEPALRREEIRYETVELRRTLEHRHVPAAIEEVQTAVGGSLMGGVAVGVGDHPILLPPDDEGGHLQ